MGKIDQALASLQIPELVDWRAREVFRDMKLGATGLFTARRRHLPGARSHPARRGIAGFSTPASSMRLAKQVHGSGRSMVHGGKALYWHG